MMWTIRKAQEETGLPYSVIRQLCLDEKVQFIRSGTKYYIYSVSLIDYLTGKAQGGKHGIQ